MTKNLSETIESSFLQYSAAVLQSRALVDVRDCVKPSARQIFYCLYTDKFLPTKPFKKTLKAIGSSMRMYIHGDSSCEGIIMRSSQPFAMRYPLIEVEGSNGNPTESGNWAAPRYSSSRLSETSMCLFSDIEKDTISEWRENYDNTEQYPAVLPTKGFYNIVNGSSGIGIAASSNIPQFNIKDVNKALEILLLNPNASFEEIYCPVDFATGGILLNEEEVKEALKNGTGKACKLRSVIEWNEDENCLVVTELPYSVYTNTICKELENIINDKEKNPGIDRFNDLTNDKPLIKIYLYKKINPSRVIKYLYKNTSLQYFYPINFTMLENGRFPKVFTWKEALQSHINHEKEVYVKGYNYDLTKIKNRLHILEGLIICINNIDDIITIIKTSNDNLEIFNSLKTAYTLDEEQIKAILQIKLASLSKLERSKIENEIAELLPKKQFLEDVLSDENLLNQEIIKGWRNSAEKFGDEHRTVITNAETEDEAEPVENVKLEISLTNYNNIYVQESSNLYISKRNKVGSKFKLLNGEYIMESINANSLDSILLFDKKGNVYCIKISQFPMNNKFNLSQVTDISNEICAITTLEKNNDKQYIIICTKNGYIKKSDIAEYSTQRKTAIKAIKLSDDDEIRSIIFTDKEKIGFLTKNGKFAIYETADITPVSRVSLGVKGMKLEEGDEIITSKIIKDSCKEIVFCSHDGYSKRIEYSEFKVTNRNTKGTSVTDSNNSEYSDFLPINDIKELVFVTNFSQIKIAVEDIPCVSRRSRGNKVIKMDEKSKIIAII